MGNNLEGIPVRPSPFDSGTVVGDDQDLASDLQIYYQTLL